MFKFKFFGYRKLQPFIVSIIIVSVVLAAYCWVFERNADELYIGAVSRPEDKIIILDAGHGGEDCGAIGVDGTYEKDLNLQFTFEIGRQLEEKNFTVVYTRTEDKLLYKPEENIKGIRKISDLKNRSKIARDYPEAIFISIHMNTFGEEKYWGTQIYTSENNPESRKLAEIIQYEIKSTLQQGNERRVKSGEQIYILKNIDNVGILIECGFLSNKAECEKLSQKEYQKQLSFSIVCGIIEYVGK